MAGLRDDPGYFTAIQYNTSSWRPEGASRKRKTIPSSRRRGVQNFAAETGSARPGVHGRAMRKKPCACRKSRCSGSASTISRRAPSTAPSTGPPTSLPVPERPTRGPEANVIRLLLYTGCRRGEIQALKWHEVDDGSLNLSDSKTTPRCVYLNQAARTIIERQHRTESA